MIQSVERAFKILKMLDSSKYRYDGIGALDLSRQIKLKFPTTHNFLKTLVELGCVEQIEETGKYRLGKEAYNLGRVHNNEKELLERAAPLVDEINRKLNETIIIVTCDNYLRNVIYQAECRQSLKVSGPLGADDHFYNTASGRALISSFDEKELKALIQQVSLPSGLSFNELKKQLVFIKEQNCEVMRKQDVTVIGVPLCKPDISLYAALGAFYPTARHTEELEQNLVNELREVAQKIEDAL